MNAISIPQPQVFSSATAADSGMGLCAPFKSRLRARCEAAYAWLCQRRKDAGPHHDVWRVRERWETLRGSILKRLRAGLYRLSPVSMADGRDGKRVECWEGEDAVVLKMLSSSLEPVLTARLSEHCHHLPSLAGTRRVQRSGGRGA